MSDRPSWDTYFLGLADYVACRSKDPSTRVGAVIVRPDKTIASVGYNGFPRGVADTANRLSDRSLKYPMTVHAELNAILVAKENLKGYHIYTTHMPCASCAGAIIQSGIVGVVSWRPSDDMLSRWRDSFSITKNMFEEARVQLLLVDGDEASRA